MIRYFAGHGPTQPDRRCVAGGWPSVETRIWRPGDGGSIGGIVEDAWARWLATCGSEWRTIGQAIPYVLLRPEGRCDRPSLVEEEIPDFLIKVHQELEVQRVEAAWDRWERMGRAGPAPELGDHGAYGHVHAHDHGICIDPLVLDDEKVSLERVLKHELAHDIAGSFGHGEEWQSMCRIIGYEPAPTEREDYRWSPSDSGVTEEAYE